MTKKVLQNVHDRPVEQVRLDDQGLLDEPGSGSGPEPGTEDEDGGQDRVHECHEMLLRLAGRAPDGLTARSREWLAHGEFAHLARAVAYWAVSQDAVLAESDVELLSDMLAEAGADNPGLAQLAGDYEPYPYYGFAPQIPPDLTGRAGGKPDPRAQADVPSDKAAVKAIAAMKGAIGLWRAWRFPSNGAAWPPAKRVFVIEISGSDEPELAARMGERLAAVGETDPQVEVYQSSTQIPVYTELAWAYGELLWAAVPESPIQLASIFDEIDDDAGPRFLPDHQALDEDEALKVAEYLHGSESLLMTESLMDDVMDPSQLSCVPMSFRTDGKWIWNEASAYYADEHQLAPDPGLLEHLRRTGYSPPPITGVDLYRALASLQDTAPDEVLWLFGSDLDESEEGQGSGAQ